MLDSSLGIQLFHCRKTHTLPICGIKMSLLTNVNQMEVNQSSKDTILEWTAYFHYKRDDACHLYSRSIKAAY